MLFFWGLHRLGFPMYLAGSVVVSLTAGVLSWWLVEKPALRLGRKLGAWSPLRGRSAQNAGMAVRPAVQLSLPLAGAPAPVP